MKPLLIIAGILMTCFTVYGVVEYKKKKDTKAFNEMYAKEVVKKDINEVSTPVGNTPINELKKQKEFNPASEKIYNNFDAAEIEKAAVIEKEPKKTTVIKKIKHRRLNLKEFSRAPLKD